MIDHRLYEYAPVCLLMSLIRCSLLGENYLPDTTKDWPHQEVFLIVGKLTISTGLNTGVVNIMVYSHVGLHSEEGPLTYW